MYEKDMTLKIKYPYQLTSYFSDEQLFKQSDK